jgi:beta-N-acetylhexosaminidase
VTDDLQMEAIAREYGLDQAITQAIEAGADILVFGNNLSYDPEITQKAITIIEDLVQSGRISQARIAESFARIMALKKKLQDFQKII